MQDPTRPTSPTDETETAEDGLRQGMTSATGRVDVPDASMGSGAGTGTFSRADDSDPEMRDAPPDSNVLEPAGEGGATGYPDQTGGTPEQ